MRRRSCAALAAVFLWLSVYGCAPSARAVRENPNTAIGAGTGVVGGAVVGGILGGKRGAVIGGLLGGLAGGAVGHYMDRKEKSLQQTSREYAYTPAQGTKLKIEAVRPSPAVLRPGETVDINLTYAVLTPLSDQQILVRETREILVDGTSVGKTEIKIEREGGTWKSTVPITLPPDAPAGTYRIVAWIDSPGGGRDVDEAFFKVRR